LLLALEPPRDSGDSDSTLRVDLKGFVGAITECNQLVRTASGIPQAASRDAGVALELFELGPPELPDVDLAVIGWTYLPEVPFFDGIILLVTSAGIA
jgi:hypothetical protein